MTSNEYDKALYEMFKELKKWNHKDEEAMSQEWPSRPEKEPNRTVREMENTVVEIFERLRLHVKQHIRDK